MKKWILVFALVTAPVVAYTHVSKEQEQVQNHVNEVHSDELLEWYQRGIEMTVLDARGRAYLDGFLLPGAKWASQKLTDGQLMALIPSKDALVVVYCSNIDCPASGWMYERLSNLGYTNLYEYPEGIDEWEDLGYPTDVMELPKL